MSCVVYFQIIQACHVCRLFSQWASTWLGSCLSSTHWHLLH